jgi:abhydrolase domain-containing protein 6
MTSSCGAAWGLPSVSAIVIVLSPALLPLALWLAVVLLGSYFFTPLRWAPLLIALERRRSGLRSKRLVVGGRTFHYLEGGRGVPVVMLHGFGASSDHWVRMSRSLVKRFRVVAPDLPGFGGTDASMAERFLVPMQAERVRAFLHELGIRRYHVVGNSMGGNVAGVLAHDHPDEVQSLTLLEPLGIESRIPTAMDLQIQKGETPLVPSTAEEFDHIVELAFVKRPFIPRAVLRYTRTKALASEPLHRVIWKDLWHAGEPYLLERNLPGIRAPTLVVWGDSNRFLHESAIEKLEKGLRDVRVVRMSACGHTPMLERPAETRKHFEEFIAHLTRPASSVGGAVTAR